MRALVSIEVPERLHRLWTATADYGWQDILWSAGVVIVALLVGRIGAYLVLRGIGRWARHTETKLDDLVLAQLGAPMRWLLPVVLARLALPLASIPPGIAAWLEHVLVIAAIAGAGWLALGAVRLLEAVVRGRLDFTTADNVRARGLATSTRVLRNIASFIVVVATIGFILMTFSQVRQVGGAVLASAGVAGLVIGFAAQKSLGTLLAGIQIAITQPVRVDDVVVIEGEWGRIEEIALTYIVVRIWDLRRLVVPVTHFLERPFQNWTRVDAKVLGTVELHVDFTVPIEPLRAELKRILDGSDKWDRATWNLQVTACSNQAMTLRALFSARNSSDQWDLRCEIRERMIGYLQRQYPQALPRLRAEVGAPLERHADADVQ